MDAGPLALGFLLFFLMPVIVALAGSVLAAGRGNRLVTGMAAVPAWFFLTWLTSLVASKQITLWSFVQPWLVTILMIGAAHAFGRYRRRVAASATTPGARYALRALAPEFLKAAIFNSCRPL